MRNENDNSTNQKRTKEEHRQYLKHKKQEEEATQKERTDEIWNLHKKALTVKPGDVIFSAQKDLFKLWLITVIAFAMLFVTILLVSRMSDQQLIIDFGEVWKGRIFQFGFSIVSSIFIFAMWYFLHDKYILQIRLLTNEGLSIKTWKLTGSAERTFEKTAWTTPTTYHEGRTNATLYNPSVNAPYTVVRPHGKKKKYIISEMGDFPFGKKVLTDILNPD